MEELEPTLDVLEEIAKARKCEHECGGAELQYEQGESVGVTVEVA
jgi:hypothetical protein